MLNSQDLQQLKIEALLQNIPNSHPTTLCADLVTVLSPSSSNHIIIKNTSNSNILSYCYILLSHIFDIRTNGYTSQWQRQHKGSMNKNSDKNKQEQLQNNQNKPKDQLNQSKFKLLKIYSFLLNQKINLCQIINIPQQLQYQLNENCQPTQPKQNKKKSINLYLKNIIHQFLKFIDKNSKSQSELSNKNNQTSSSQTKQFSIAMAFQQYSICEIIMTIFLRTILYFQYEIMQAIDYNQLISDHTVYSALCDAFQYNSLKLQQNYAQISHGSCIQVIKMKEINDNVENKINRNILNYYLVSVPLYKIQCLPIKQIQDLDSFRKRRKSSDNESNNQSISFRQISNKKIVNNQIYKTEQVNKKFIVNENVNLNICAEQQKIRKNSKQFSDQRKNSIQNQPEQLEVITEHRLSENDQNNDHNEFIQKLQNYNKRSKSVPQETTKPLFNTTTDDLSDYTNIYVLKHLSPTTQDSMIKNISHFRGAVL